MNCKSCGGKGWVEGVIMMNASEKPTIRRCINCSNSKGYSDEIKKRFDSSDEETQQEKINRLIGKNNV